MKVHYGNKEPLDFLSYDGEAFDGDIVKNPPYSQGGEFVEKGVCESFSVNKIS